MCTFGTAIECNLLVKTIWVQSDKSPLDTHESIIPFYFTQKHGIKSHLTTHKRKPQMVSNNCT